jgi:O-antigen/teichoic acid export membrane protein
LIKIILHTFASKLLNALINLGLVVITARMLGAEVRGEISLLIATLYLFVLASGFVGGSTLIYLAPRFPAKKLLVLSYGWGTLVALGILPLIYLSFGLPQPQLGHWMLLALLFNLTAVNRYMLLAEQQIKVDNLLGIGINLALVLLLGLLLLGKADKTLETFILAFYTAWGAAFFLSFWLVRHSWAKDQPQTWKTVWLAMWKYGSMAQGANFAQFLGYRIQFYLIGALLSKEALGVFSVAVALSEALWMITQSISLVQLSKIANMEDGRTAAGLTATLMKLSVGVTALAMVVLLLLPEHFYVLVFGPDFSPVKSLILYMVPGILALAASNILIHYYAGIGRLWINFLISLLTLVLVAGINYVIMPVWGLSGAAIASSIAYGVAALVIALYFIRDHKQSVGMLLPQRADWTQFQLLYKQYVRNLRAD